MTALGASSGASYPTCKFVKHGDSHTGTIVQARDMQAREYGTGKPLEYPDGNPQLVTVVTLDVEPSGERMNLYIKAGRMRNAGIAALNDAGARDLEPGGKLKYQYINDVEGKRGGTAKDFRAWYKPAPPGYVAPVLEEDDIPASAFQDDEPPF